MIPEKMPEPVICERCKNPFECKSFQITECQCYGIDLNEKERAYLSEKYKSCLCRNCLTEMLLMFR